MDKLAKQLKSDAMRIDAKVSDELQSRIEASLRAAGDEKSAAVEMQPPRMRFWWASSLTGVAAALVIIAIINSRSQPENDASQFADTTPGASVLAVPAIDWKAESAMLTSPLQQELDDLRTDIKKAEQKVRDDIGL